MLSSVYAYILGTAVDSEGLLASPLVSVLCLLLLFFYPLLYLLFHSARRCAEYQEKPAVKGTVNLLFTFLLVSGWVLS